jgi:hypothetical protein
MEQSQFQANDVTPPAAKKEKKRRKNSYTSVGRIKRRTRLGQGWLLLLLVVIDHSYNRSTTNFERRTDSVEARR